MQNSFIFAILLALAAPLAGCGISGGLKTPPPIWGEANPDMPVETDEDATIDPAQTVISDNPLDDEEDDDVGYGVDVADTP